MAKCKKCGEPLSSGDICPKCGINPGPETITDLPKAKVKDARKKLRDDVKFEREREELVAEAECRSCGELLGKDVDICPKCGLAGGPETITDLPPANLREAHRKLKAEIKGIREQKKLDD